MRGQVENWRAGLPRGVGTPWSGSRPLCALLPQESLSLWNKQVEGQKVAVLKSTRIGASLQLKPHQKEDGLVLGAHGVQRTVRGSPSLLPSGEMT